MKIKSFAITLLIAATACVLCSCSHNAELLGIGTAFRIGSGEFSANYADGLFLNSVSRDNMRFNAELDSTMGLTYDPVSNTYKGIKSISYEIGPQLGGYSKELGEKSPEALKSYYDATAKYYEYRIKQDATPVSNKTAISDEKSKDATQQVSDIIKKALEKAKSIVGKLDPDDENVSFQCDGNCEYDNLSGNKDIAYQLSIATKLLTYDGYTNKMEGSGEYYTQTLEHFITQLTKFQAKGHKSTPLMVKYVTVKDKVITRLMYIYVRKDGSSFNTECPSCVLLDDEDAD